MRKAIVTLLAVVPCLVFAQVKPSIPKAEKALREGKVDEAKTIIDATTGSQEFMVDKKGQPSKNAAKAWFLRGVIYSAMDTTKSGKFANLDPNPFAVAKDAFEKSKAIDSKSDYFLTDAMSLPILNDNAKQMIGYSYYMKTVELFNAKGDPNLVFASAERTLYYIPNDTTFLLYAGGAFAPAAAKYDEGIALMRRYIEQGGKLPEVYTEIAKIYVDHKKDIDAALKILAEGKLANPQSKDIRNAELNIYIDQKKYAEARTMIEGELAVEPNNATSYYQLGLLNRELGDRQKSKDAFEKALVLEPTNSDAAKELAGLYWADAKEIRDQMGMLANSKADMEKRKALDVKYVEKLKLYLPKIEAVEKMAPDDIDVLYALLNVYGDLGDDPKVARTKKRLKALGEDIN